MERGPRTVWATCLWACFLVTLLSSQCGAFSEEFPSDQKVLVLLDNLSRRSSHSVYFQSLTDRGYELDFKLAEDPKLALQRYGQYLYDALILFAPSVERFGGSVDAAAVLDFVDSGHDLVLAADVSTSDVIRDIATECGVDFDEDVESVVIDHISFAKTAHGDRSLIVGDKLIDSPVILGEDSIKEPILFRGIGHSVNTSELVVKVLSASPSAFSGKLFVPLKEPPVLSGTSIGLVSVVQARNNARILVSGSLDLFSDEFFKSEVRVATDSERYPKSGNEKFATELTKWVFHERGHLKALNLRHKKVDEEGEPPMYRITDNLEFSVDIYEWTGKHWHPYQAGDVQVQFYMMSPYIRKTLSHDGKGHYHTKFQVPDVYGVFQFKVEYWRLGYTSLTLSKQIPVRPFRHNEYERFIPAAFPYYGASFSMMVAFFIFGLVFLYQK